MLYEFGMGHHRCWLLAGILISASACHFEGSTAGDPDVLVDDPVEEGSGPETPDRDRDEPAPTYFATGEATSEGERFSGSYEDLGILDGTAEIIRAEIRTVLDAKVEKLTHQWFFADMAPGQYELTFVAHPYSPVELETFTIDYKAGSNDRMRILVMPAGKTMTSFVGRVDVSVQGDVDIRALLTEDAPVVSEEPGEGGGIGFGFGGFGNHGNGEGPQAQRALEVDYIALTLKNQITN